MKAEKKNGIISLALFLEDGHSWARQCQHEKNKNNLHFGASFVERVETVKDLYHLLSMEIQLNLSVKYCWIQVFLMCISVLGLAYLSYSSQKPLWTNKKVKISAC